MEHVRAIESPETQLTTLATARRLKLSTDRVRQLERAGILRAQRTALGRLFDPSDVARLAKARAAQRRKRAE